MNPIFKHWLVLVFIITIFSGLAYLVTQQNLRQSANDPQIQISEDLAEGLANGQQLPETDLNNAFDISKSLSTFVVVYDDSGKPIVSTAKLNNQVPIIPSGIFNYVKNHHQTRITWQPQKGVRSAIVVTRYTGTNSGYVLAGRSLREIENRETQLEFQIGAVWFFSLISSLIFLFLLEKLFNLHPIIISKKNRKTS